MGVLLKQLGLNQVTFSTLIRKHNLPKHHETL
jgi:hypothetical protein